MRASILRFATVLFGLAAASMVQASAEESLPAIPSGIRVVGVANGEVTILAANRGHPTFQPLTHGGGIKFSPVWSPDGSKIAYVWKESSEFRAHSVLFIIDSTGRVSSKTNIDYYDDLTWIDNDHILIQGEVNPSASNYSLINARTGAYTARDMFDSLSALSYTRDGKYHVITDGCPHFLPRTDCDPDIRVNGRLVLTLEGVKAQLLAPPQWSDRRPVIGSIVQTLPHDTFSAVFVDVVQLNHPRITRVSIPALDPDSADSKWIDGKFYVFGRTRGAVEKDVTWLVDQSTGTAVASRPISELDKLGASARELRTQLVDTAKSYGLSDADAWCADCPLVVLPRASWDEGV